jgi:RNA polymerase sigma-70 factor (ECF subfamily)
MHSIHAMLQLPMSTGTRQVGRGVLGALGAQAEDGALLERVRAGDRAAEELLYRQHVDAVMGLAVRLLGRAGEAEDVVHDAFVTAFESLDRVRDPAAFRAWLLRVTVRHAHRRFRRRTLLRRLGLDHAADDAALAQLAAPGLPSEAIAELRKLDGVLARLPAEQRIAWLLRHVEGLELAEVAAACGVSLATVKRRIAAAQAHVDRHVLDPETGAR